MVTPPERRTKPTARIGSPVNRRPDTDESSNFTASSSRFGATDDEVRGRGDMDGAADEDNDLSFSLSLSDLKKSNNLPFNLSPISTCGEEDPDE